mmetsp:Transcript_19764/g.24072  ORF Transcript_19764/g.24072 Transcript_19764/m.24072 type:complete len:442 (-) Transcript_19764:39-1364(-)
MALLLRKVRTIFLGATALTAGGSAAYILSDEERRKVVPGTLDGSWRFARTSLNAIITAVDYKYSLYGLNKEADEIQYKQTLTAANLRFAKRLYKVCHSHGGLYNKFAQYVSTMNHVLPNEIVDTLSPLQDKAKEVSPEVAAEAVKSELNIPHLNDIFLEFDPEPIAAASLAQVHRARIKDGREVAVKIQYPHLRQQTIGDVATMKLLSTLVGWVFPDFNYSWLVREFEDTVILELDFLQEARNAKRLAMMFSHRTDVYVPEIVDDLSTERLLVMDFVRGYKPTDTEGLISAGLPRDKVAKTISTVFGDMIHVHGFVHCDPHAGNLLVRHKANTSSWWSQFSTGVGMICVPALAITGAFHAAAVAAVISGTFALYNQNKDPLYELVVLDHGMYRRLEPNFRRLYCQLWESLLLRDHNLGRRTGTFIYLFCQYLPHRNIESCS